MDREKAAAAAWSHYHKAIKEYGLDEQDLSFKKPIQDFMYDGFFAGFYSACRMILDGEDDR